MKSEVMFKGGIIEMTINKEYYDDITYESSFFAHKGLRLFPGEASRGFKKIRVLKSSMFEDILKCIIFNPPDELWAIKDLEWTEANSALSKYIFNNVNDSQFQLLMLWIPKMIMGKGLKEGEEKVKQKIRTQLGL